MAKRLTTEIFIERAENIHGKGKYDYSETVYVNSSTDVGIICPIHGLFIQNPRVHLLGCGCPFCSRTYQKTREELIAEFRKVHGDKYDYSKMVYVNANTNIDIICPIHGVFSQNPRSHLKGHGCAKCANRVAKTTEDFIKEAKLVHGDKYDYSETVYVNNHTNVKIFCKKDKIFFMQNPRVHLMGMGCPKCARNQKLTTEGFIERAIAIHGNKYDYSLVVYQSHAKKVTIICPIHGPFEQRANGHLNGKGCPKCAAAAQRSKGEIEMCDFIKSIYSGKILENDRTAIKPKELDIFLPELNLAFEYNGEYWHDETKKRKPGYHKNKQKACEKKSIKLIEIWDLEWHANKDKFKNLIQETINSIQSPSKI